MSTSSMAIVIFFAILLTHYFVDTMKNMEINYVSLLTDTIISIQNEPTHSAAVALLRDILARPPTTVDTLHAYIDQINRLATISDDLKARIVAKLCAFANTFIKIA
jgi:hypothetical protein